MKFVWLVSSLIIWSSPSPNSRKRFCSSGEAQSCLMRTATPALTRLRGQISHRDSSRKADSNAFGTFILNDLTLTEAANTGHTFLAISLAQIAVEHASPP